MSVQALPVPRRDAVVSGPWCLLWYRLKAHVDTRQLDAAAAADAVDNSPGAEFYRGMTAAYADLMRYMNETEAVLTRPLTAPPACPASPVEAGITPR